MPVQNEDPIIIPEKIYDLWWFTAIVITATDPSLPVRAEIVAAPARQLEDETIEIAPESVGRRLLVINDLYGAVAEGDTDLGAAVQGVLAIAAREVAKPV